MHKALIASLLLVAAPLSFSTAAHAEGEDGPPPKPKVVKKKPRPAPAATMPAAPIPYTTYAGISVETAPEVAQALTPSTPPGSDQAVTPDVMPQPAETSLTPMQAPPPPPPSQMAEAAPSTPPPAEEIQLRCETKTTEGKRLVSQGTFYIDLFPSPVFPDRSASFKFLLADPNHRSLIRDTICLDTLCPAEVSGAAYYLVNRVTKKGEALRITLDRTKGAFYAESVGKGMIGGAHLGEQGYCTPQPLPAVKF